MPARFPRLFDPLTLRSVTVRNRLVVCPMGCRFVVEGRPTTRDFAFYRARAEGGAGLIIMGGTIVHPTSLLKSRKAIEAYERDAIPALAELSAAIHHGGAKVIGQLNHRGREMLGHDSEQNRDVDFPTWAPSPLASPNDPLVPHEMNLDEIREVIEAFCLSARNLVRAGFDGIEIHAAHGYLVGQFLSPQANMRMDAYGGAAENRARLLVDLIAAVRDSIGPTLPLGVRLSADEELDGGLTVTDSCDIARRVADTHQVDYLSVTRGIRNRYVKDMSYPLGVSVELARAVRDASRLSTMVAGRINHPALAEDVLKSGAADLVGMARAWIVDAEWGNKSARGQLTEIRPCIGCLQDCRSGGMACVHNPTAGRETIWPIKLPRAKRPRKVVVVGGGPGGLEAATVASQLGHQVILFERHREFGGQVRLAARAPHRTEIDGVVGYRLDLLATLPIDVRLGSEAMPDTVLTENPDCVIIATGAQPRPPELEGADDRVITPWQLLEEEPATRAQVSAAQHCVVVDDGSGFWETFGAVEYLAERGHTVTLISPARTLGAGIPYESIEPLLRRLRKNRVELMPMYLPAWLEPGELVIYDRIRFEATRTLKEIHLPADLVIVNAGRVVLDTLHRALRSRSVCVRAVGDCVAPRRISQAIYEAHRAARAI